ncbi:receptor-interacting serine/threonine-protein kinase 2 isoform X2 [Xenopus tropicalis]|uniref:Receptor-interacting serine/threonine-protein kinase 2 n=1 Tax=Xenopus tropicalis TaxID=8364 RepID=A0A8J1JQ37_XENTR|nr:receptor-interacting serine/threonine-protein kinase 2 isoform X2 [Xenopus tropicalis]
MSSGDGSRGSASTYPSGTRYSLNLEEGISVPAASISSSLQCIPYQKLTDLKFINKGAYGTVHSACHSDWRVRVAVKFFPTERHLVESERNKILKEAEILHKARFSYILPILGICNEPECLGIVTEYMTNGSLNQLLHENAPRVEIVWPLAFRILYEIALGVNFLHNLTPSLLHHDLKTQNILLDRDFHAKIADFGLSKWRMLSSSHSYSDQSTPGGTIIYMPPEEYEPSSARNRRGSVKHDMYSFAIIMWEVLARKQPYEGATTPMQIMFSVSKGNRPDLSEESLPSEIPHRDLFISLMQSGWATDPNDRPAFIKCLLELEPIIRNYDEILILEGILQIKKMKTNFQHNSISNFPTMPCVNLLEQPAANSSNENVNIRKSEEYVIPQCSSVLNKEWNVCPRTEPVKIENEDISFTSPTRCLKSSIPYSVIPAIPCGIMHPEFTERQSARPTWEMSDPVQESPFSALQWILLKRHEIINQMTEACLNQCLDALISRMVILKEDYELIKSKQTRSSKVRQLIDTCDSQGEIFARVIVQKLRENRQNDLQPFPEI